MGNHGKCRCNDYLGLLYLMVLAGEASEVIGRALDDLESRLRDRDIHQHRSRIRTYDMRCSVRGDLKTSQV